MSQDEREQLRLSLGILRKFINKINKQYTPNNLYVESNISKGLMAYKLVVKVYGTEEDEWDFGDYLHQKGLQDVAYFRTITQDVVYGLIKEVEYIKGYQEENKVVDVSQEPDIENGLTALIEQLSGVFNDWESYKDAVNDSLSVRQEKPEEFTYEELIERGETPNYTSQSQSADEPMSRVERRKRRTK